MIADQNFVLELLRSAFKNSVRPAHSELVEGSSMEAAQIREYFDGKDWCDVTLKSLQDDYVGDGSASLWFMTPKSVLYYLPSYLKISVEDYLIADSISVETVAKLLRVAQGEDNNISSAVLLMSGLQKKAVASVLAYISRHYETTNSCAASDALSLYWKDFLD